MKVVFLDRDGVINKYPGDLDYVKSWDEFHFLPKVKSALKKLTDCGFKLFIISNQAGVSRGIYTQEALDLITRNMLNELRRHAIEIAGVYYCTHRQEDNCSCRKPKTGLIELAKKKYFLNLKNSYFIGDSIRDVKTAKQAGLKSILILSGKEKISNRKKWEEQPDFIHKDLHQATEFIISQK